MISEIKLSSKGNLAGVSSYALSIKNGFIPPTINYTTPDENCDLDYVPNQGRNTKVSYAMSNSFGFGGHNAVIIFKEYN
jgi:3-oxoacyl-[acyl-carrier-protein] synthase II